MRQNARQTWAKLSERLNDSLDIPKTALPGVAQIELSGNREALVDGCCGILQYTDTAIRLSTGSLIVRFTGSDLRVCAMQSGQIRITGLFAAIDFTS